MEAGQLINMLVGIVLAGIIGAVVLCIVSSLKLGLWVRGFGPAFIAAIVIAIVGTVVRFVLAATGVQNLGGIVGFVERLIISAALLLIADKLLAGLTIKGFKGAIIAALAISVISWVAGLFLEAMGIPLVV
jgi:putative membrane protein